MPYLGQYFPIDEQGYVLNPTDETLVPKWVRDQMELVIDAYHQYFKNLQLAVKTIFLRGSAARGQFVSGVSDLDTVALVVSDEKIRWAPLAIPAASKIPSTVEWVRTDWFDHKPEMHPRVCQVLKTQALPVWGEDVRALLPPVPLSLDLILERKWVDQDLLAYRSQPSVANQQQFLKSLLRAKGGSLLVQSGRFSPDLDLCVQAMIEFFPEGKAFWQKLLQAFLHPNAVPDQELEESIRAALAC